MRKKSSKARASSSKRKNCYGKKEKMETCSCESGMSNSKCCGSM